LLVVGPVERRVSAEEDVEDDACAPDVALFIVLLPQNFRSYVVRSSELLLEEDPCSEFGGCAEVDDLDFRILVVLVKQEVLGLEVPVHDVLAVDVVERGEHLLHDVGRVPLAEVLLLCDLVEELTSETKPNKGSMGGGVTLLPRKISFHPRKIRRV